MLGQAHAQEKSRHHGRGQAVPRFEHAGHSGRHRANEGELRPGQAVPVGADSDREPLQRMPTISLLQHPKGAVPLHGGGVLLQVLQDAYQDPGTRLQGGGDGVRPGDRRAAPFQVVQVAFRQPPQLQVRDHVVQGPARRLRRLRGPGLRGALGARTGGVPMPGVLQGVRPLPEEAPLPVLRDDLLLGLHGLQGDASGTRTQRTGQDVPELFPRTQGV
mmetsp:Transcript_7548/g.18219  ORF Transcript_7548/g.18219 Transcript_7548/m.18219 type:complete len:217 (+) Transcript_7548:892-1542(+)